MCRRSKYRCWTLALVVIIAIGGCARNGERADGEGRTTTIGTDCFTTSLARDFRYLDDRNLIVYAPRQAYHVELSGICVGLRGQARIALRSRSDRMCGFAGDAILVNGSFPERCPVLSVRRLDDNALEELLDLHEREEPGDAVQVEIPAAEDEDAPE